MMTDPTPGIRTLGEVARERIAECADVARARFREAILPVYGALEDGRADQLGSATLIEIDERRFLVTAAHVLDEAQHSTLYVGRKTPTPILGNFYATTVSGGGRACDHYDFAFCELSDALRNELMDTPAIGDFSSWRGDRARSFTCLGYPNSKNEAPRPTKSTLRPMLGSYTDNAFDGGVLKTRLNVSGDDHLFLHFDPKRAADESGNRLTPPSMKGFSGGGVFDLGDLTNPDSLSSPCHPRLAGIIIESHAPEKALVATRIDTILRALGAI